MTAEINKDPFAEVARYIDDRLHPKGSPAEPQPIPVASVDEIVRRFADELEEPALRSPLVDLLHDFQDNPAVDGVGLVVIAGRHLSVRVLTDTNGTGEQWEKDMVAIGQRYDAFAQSLYDTMPESRSVSWGLSYYSTGGGDVATLVPGILEEISKEVDASTVAFVMFERPAPIPQV